MPDVLSTSKLTSCFTFIIAVTVTMRCVAKTYSALCVLYCW